MSEHPSDYSFLKSGFDILVKPDQPDEETLLTVSSMVTAFMDNALRDSATYVEHAKRNGITKEDIILSLKSETFKFLNRPDVNNSVKKWREIIEDERVNSSDDDEGDEYDSDTGDDIDNETKVDDLDLKPINDFTPSECKCELCQEINSIENLWSTWVAQTPIEKVLKQVIDTKF